MSIVAGINELDQVVGTSFLAGDAITHGFLYSEGVMYDLNDLIISGSGVTNIDIGAYEYQTGNPINDLGQIAANGIIGGQQHALLLTPTPEPASAALLLGGGALLVGRRRRVLV